MDECWKNFIGTYTEKPSMSKELPPYCFMCESNPFTKKIYWDFPAVYDCAIQESNTWKKSQHVQLWHMIYCFLHFSNTRWLSGSSSQSPCGRQQVVLPRCPGHLVQSPWFLVPWLYNGFKSHLKPFLSSLWLLTLSLTKQSHPNPWSSQWVIFPEI